MSKHSAERLLHREIAVGRCSSECPVSSGSTLRTCVEGLQLVPPPPKKAATRPSINQEALVGFSLSPPSITIFPNVLELLPQKEPTSFIAPI